MERVLHNIARRSGLADLEEAAESDNDEEDHIKAVNDVVGKNVRLALIACRFT